MRIVGTLLIGVWLAWAGLPARCEAWGPEGHRIIAEIAQLRLTQKTRDKIVENFNIKRLSKVANWADKIKHTRENEKPWHYTNIPEGIRTYKKSRDCPRGDCVTEIIPRFAKILADPKAGKNERKEALKYLVHFVGDIHQPVHVGNKKDRGGNNIQLYYHFKETNLHALWDSKMIPKKRRQSLVNYARFLNRKIRAGEAKQWVRSDTLDWTRESRALALDVAYPLQLNSLGQLKMEYEIAGHKVIASQLQKAGVRLAYLLETVLN